MNNVDDVRNLLWNTKRKLAKMKFKNKTQERYAAKTKYMLNWMHMLPCDSTLKNWKMPDYNDINAMKGERGK